MCGAALDFVIRDFVLNAPKDPIVKSRRRMQQVLDDLKARGQLRHMLQTQCTASITNSSEPLASQQWYLSNIGIQVRVQGRCSRHRSTLPQPSCGHDLGPVWHEHSMACVWLIGPKFRPFGPKATAF